MGIKGERRRRKRRRREQWRKRRQYGFLGVISLFPCWAGRKMNNNFFIWLLQLKKRNVIRPKCSMFYGKCFKCVKCVKCSMVQHFFNPKIQHTSRRYCVIHSKSHKLCLIGKDALGSIKLQELSYFRHGTRYKVFICGKIEGRKRRRKNKTTIFSNLFYSMLSCRFSKIWCLLCP